MDDDQGFDSIPANQTPEQWEELVCLNEIVKNGELTDVIGEPLLNRIAILQGYKPISEKPVTALGKLRCKFRSHNRVFDRRGFGGHYPGPYTIYRCKHCGDEAQVYD